MPKLKSHKGAAKRFKQTAGGFKVRAANRNHILTKRNTKNKRHLRVDGVFVAKSDEKSVARLLHGS